MNSMSKLMIGLAAAILWCTAFLILGTVMGAVAYSWRMEAQHECLPHDPRSCRKRGGRI